VPDKNIFLELAGWCGFLISAAFGNPIPEEVMLAMAGVRAATWSEAGAYRWLLLPVCIVGAVIADLGLYAIGRFFGQWLLERPWIARLAPPEKRERTRENFHRYGVSILVFGRLVPGIRTTLFLTAGMMRLSMTRFLLADGLGAVLGNSMIFLLAYGLGSQFTELVERIEKEVNAAKPIIILVLVLAVSGYLLYLFLRRPFPTGDPEEIPVIGSKVAAHLPIKHGDAPPDKQPEAAPDGKSAASREEGLPS
jgi:membrane protein DedA with SNARE-associated domain